MTSTSPLPEGSSPVSDGGQGFCFFRRLSDRRMAAGKSLREVNYFSCGLHLETVLEISMNHVSLYCKLFCQLFLMIVQQVWIGNNDNGHRNS